ncbi:MAG: ABC transporter ATP-binding protein [Limnochordaceae bacterium]|nr:ABC transporter ATP-binding protein [Limnochordaceae bacterium]
MTLSDDARLPRPLLEVDDVSVVRGGSVVLENVSLSVQPSELLGVIGPNGAGKSTLLQAMAGLLPHSTGSVRFAGEPIEGWPRRRLARRLALVGQATGWSFALPIREVVALGRYPYQPWWGGESPVDRQAVQDALAWTNLTELAARPVTAVSGGEAQRVLLAQALAQIWQPGDSRSEPETPPVLLLDEPTAHLDLGYQVGFFSLWRQIQTRLRAAIVVVLHDLNLAGRFCDRLLLLSQGHVVDWGRPEQVLQREQLERVYGTPLWVGHIVENHPGDPGAVGQASPQRSAGIPVVLPAPPGACHGRV